MRFTFTAVVYVLFINSALLYVKIALWSHSDERFGNWMLQICSSSAHGLPCHSPTLFFFLCVYYVLFSWCNMDTSTTVPRDGWKCSCLFAKRLSQQAEIMTVLIKWNISAKSCSFLVTFCSTWLGKLSVYKVGWVSVSADTESFCKHIRAIYHAWEMQNKIVFLSISEKQHRFFFSGFNLLNWKFKPIACNHK